MQDEIIRGVEAMRAKTAERHGYDVKRIAGTCASVPRSAERSMRRPCRVSRMSSRTSGIGSSRCFLFSGKALVRLKSGVRRGENTFDALMKAVTVCSLGPHHARVLRAPTPDSIRYRQNYVGT